MGPGQEERLIRSHWLESVLLHHLALALLPAPPIPPPIRACSWTWKGNERRILGKVEGLFFPSGSKTSPQACLSRCQEAARRKKEKQSPRSGVQTS